tara:strand:- start:2928 stop:3137 length:210 start_codon:yes stop_codon:yes gene_type:complete
MQFQFFHNNQKVCEGFLKQHAYKISKLINENPEDKYTLKILKPYRRKLKVTKELTNSCDIAEFCLYSLF